MRDESNLHAAIYMSSDQLFPLLESHHLFYSHFFFIVTNYAHNNSETFAFLIEHSRRSFINFFRAASSNAVLITCDLRKV